MFSFKSIVLIATAFAIGAECSVPVAAPLLAAPAAVGYANAIPQNIPPFASQVSVVNRALSPLVAAPLAAPVAAPFAAPFAAPYAAAPYAAAPYTAGPYAAATLAAAPYLAGPASVLPGPYAASYGALPGPAAYAAPYPYAAAAPLVRAPLGLAPAFVR